LADAERGGLDDGADCHDYGTANVDWLPPESVTQREDEDGSEHRADFVRRDQEAEERGIRVSELAKELWRCGQTTHES